MIPVTPEDDRFHPVAVDDPMWTETSWYAFNAKGGALAGTIYPLFRPQQGVCSVAVHVWDEHAFEPWRVPYSRTQWHLPMPEGDLTDCEVGGLRYTCLEPLSRYRVQYADGDLIDLDLEYTGLIEPHGVGPGGQLSHVDQPCRVTGTLRLRGEEIAVDCLDMRDRSWNVRDDRRDARAAYSYGIAGADDAFLAGAFGPDETCIVVTGYLVRDGEKADLTGGKRQVLAREHGYPTRVAIEAQDRLGRRLEVEGRCRSRLANQATPGMFAWMSVVDWARDGGPISGEDQDVWSPGNLARSP